MIPAKRGRSDAFSPASLLSPSRGGLTAPTPTRRGRTRWGGGSSSYQPAGRPLSAHPGGSQACGGVCSKASRRIPAVNFILITAPRKVPAPRTAVECKKPFCLAGGGRQRKIWGLREGGMLCEMEARIPSAPSKYYPQLKTLPSLECSVNKRVSGELRVSGSDLPGIHDFLSRKRENRASNMPRGPLE